MKKNKKPKMLKVVISRKKWNRGTDNGYLCNESGAKCALGWALTAAGVPKSKMENLCGVDEVLEEYASENKHPPETINHFVNDYDFKHDFGDDDNGNYPEFSLKSVLGKIIATNDEPAIDYDGDRVMTAREREDKLKKLMKEIDIDLSFKD